MLADERLERIVSFVEEHGFATVKELSKLHNVSEVTIRRDLQRLYEEKRLRRTYGGAASLRSTLPADSEMEQGQPPELASTGFFTDRVDVLIATSFEPRPDQVLLDRIEQRNVSVIAESTDIPGTKTLVAVDNYQASFALGRWAGRYAQQHFKGQAAVLDLTYHLSNTQTRSQGFIAGLKEILPMAHTVLSINAQSAWQTAYQLTTDALQVYPTINIIFAINDSTAWGAIQACQDTGVNPDTLLVIPFGLEGNTLKNALMAGAYCKVGLAMFPEIVGRVCIEAAINAYNNEPMPQQLVTPNAILTSESLPKFYTQGQTGWQINWDAVNTNLTIPLNINPAPRQIDNNLPGESDLWFPIANTSGTKT